MLSEYNPPKVQWNEVLPLELVPSPCCGETGMEKVGVDPGGVFLWMRCRRCDEVSKLSG